MQNFLKIAEGVDVIPTLAALNRHADLWNENRLRTTHPDSPHTEVDDIWCMFNQVDPENQAATIDALQTYPYRAWNMLPHLRAVVLDVMRRVDGVQLGRVIISRMKPGAKIAPHIDQGAPAEFYHRYQLALQCRPGCQFIIEDEALQMRPGEVWQINNRRTHSVVNNSDADRIAVIIDIRSA